HTYQPTAASPPQPSSFSFTHPPPRPTLFPYTTLFRSLRCPRHAGDLRRGRQRLGRAGDEPVASRVRGPGVHDVLREAGRVPEVRDRKSTRLNSSHVSISYAVFCLKKKTLRPDWTQHSS